MARTDSPNALIAGPDLHIVDYCSAACLLLRRDTFLTIGGFDPVFEPAYFEDADLSFVCVRWDYIPIIAEMLRLFIKKAPRRRAFGIMKHTSRTVTESHRKFLLRWG